MLDWCSFSSPWWVLLSLSLLVDHYRTSSPLASFFINAMSPNLICLTSCLAWCSKWRVRTRKYFGQMDAKLVFFKNSFNAYVSQSYFGVRFVPFNLLPEFPTFGFQDFSWYLELFVLKYVNLCVVLIQELLDTSWKRRHCVWFVF